MAFFYWTLFELVCHQVYKENNSQVWASPRDYGESIWRMRSLVTSEQILTRAWSKWCKVTLKAGTSIHGWCYSRLKGYSTDASSLESIRSRRSVKSSLLILGSTSTSRTRNREVTGLVWRVSWWNLISFGTPWTVAKEIIGWLRERLEVLTPPLEHLETAMSMNNPTMFSKSFEWVPQPIPIAG